MMAIPDPLKKEILHMLPREKDKLLLRLINKDRALVDRLYFELIEGSATLSERRDALRHSIDKAARMKYSSSGWILTEMRSLSGDIAYHVKITRDKYGEADLNVYLLNAFLEHQADQLRTYSSRTDKCALYMAKKAQTALNRLAKLNPDYYVDFEREVNALLQRIYTLCTQYYARQLNLPKYWP
jgi:hypothetical protein